MSVVVISKSFPLSSSTTNGGCQKQGIVSILGSDTNEKGSKAGSLRRTLSADMSSKKWLAQNGMKKIASSQHLGSIDSSSSSEEDEEDDDKPLQSDIWSKIVSQKAINGPLYVHPLVRRSSSSLSEKSLEICTESLGSETGSDVVLSSYPPSGEVGEEKNSDSCSVEEFEFFCKDENFTVIKYNYLTTDKKSSIPPTARSFPPMLPSLERGDGPSLHMHSHRQNGRLVLEAVSIPSQNFFKAHRQNGRLQLTLVNNPLDASSDQLNQFDIFEEEDTKEEEIDYDEEEVEEEEMIETNYWYKSPPKLSEVINVHRSALMLKKHNEIANKKQPQSFPARVTAAGTATSFNSYEYFWRANPTMASVINTPIKSSLQSPVALKKNSHNKELVLLRGNKADCLELVPLLRGCKKPSRSLLFLEPHCIATS